MHRTPAANADTAVRPGEITVLGRTIAHVRGGEGERDVVFIHGFGADRSSWMFNLPALAGMARVFAPDLPGHGRSSLDVGAGDIRFLADIVRGYMDAAGIGKATVVGHSLGGAIALELAANERDRVEALFLIAPMGFGQTVNREFTDAFVALDSTEEARATLALLVARPALVNPQMLEDVLVYVRRPGVRDALRKIADAVFPHGQQRCRYDEKLAELAIPVELIWGARDRVLAPWQAAPDSAALRLIEDAGHMPHMEKPRQVNEMLVRAVARK